MMNETDHSVAISERALKQRERILEAARLCFVKHGFHGASIANIAEEAGMSPGLMYRYFDNKNAIIQAIVHRQLDFGRQALQEITSPGDLVQGILKAMERWRSGGPNQMSAPLFLEISAQATRDPEIAAIVAEADALLRKHMQETMQRTASSKGLFEDEVRAKPRMQLLMSLVEGLSVRSCREAGLDGELLQPTLAKLIAELQSE
jgi:AcrR family transcriptional regulator